MGSSLDQVFLSAADWVAIGLYMAFTVGCAVWVKFGQEGSEDFFLAGRSMSWLIVTISTFATLFSTISFVAVPGEAYGNGLLFSLILPLSVLFYPLGIWLFLRFFFRVPTFTAYEYLERRFNVGTRLVGAACYCLVRLLYSGVVFYSAAVVLESLVGWSPVWTIPVVGAFTIAYTTTGGMKADMITDVVQFVVIVLGIGGITWLLLAPAGFDVGAIYRYAAEQGKGFGPMAERSFYALDLHDRVSFWLILLPVVTTPLLSLSCDQSVVQRLLAVKSYGEAKRSVLVTAVISVPIMGLLWFIGLALLYRYGPGGAALPEGLTSDQVMGYFIATQLPSPLPGLIVAALLAALMSTIDSTANCIANVLHRDFLLRLGAMREGERRELWACRVLTVAAGVAGVGLAMTLVLMDEGVKTSVFEVSAVWSSLWGILLMTFLLGVLAPWVSGRAMLAGMLLGAALNLYLPWALYYAVPAEQRISFGWVSVPGMLVTLLVPLGLSLVWRNRKPVVNLTHWTLDRRSPEDTTDEGASGEAAEPAATLS